MFKEKWFIAIIAFLMLAVLLIACSSTNKESREEIKEETVEQTEEKYPPLAKETMDRDCILNALGGDEVSLWDKPTDAAGGARLHDRVPCGTRCWAFNKYYNKELGVTFYAVNTFDPRVKNAYGWVTEDLITWSE